MDEASLERYTLNIFNSASLIDVLKGDTRTTLTPPESLFQAIQLCVNLKGSTPYSYVYYVKDKPVAIGQVRVGQLNTAELGLCVNPEYRRKGYGVKVMRDLIQIASTLNMKNLVADTDVDNHACIRLLESMRFTVESRNEVRINYIFPHDIYTKERLCQYQRSAS